MPIVYAINGDLNEEFLTSKICQEREYYMPLRDTGIGKTKRADLPAGKQDLTGLSFTLN